MDNVRAQARLAGLEVFKALSDPISFWVLESNSPYRVLDSGPEGPQGGSPLLYLSDYPFLFLWRVP